MRTLARLAAVALLVAPQVATAAEDAAKVQVDPRVRGVQGMGVLAGRVVDPGGQPETTDLMIVIDVSDSTSRPSGADIDGDGKARGMATRDSPWLATLLGLVNVGGWLTDTTDTVLAAEMSAARNLLDQLDPQLTRVGVITFSGDGDPRSQDADVIAPLTEDYAAVRRAIDAELERGPRGRTNILTGIRLAAVELNGTVSAQSRPRAGARKVALLFSDGYPTLPVDGAMGQNRGLTVEAARRAAQAGVRIHTYGVGDEADPACLGDVARVSQGTFTSVQDPGALRAEVSKIELRAIGELEIENLATGARATRIVRSPDGNFFALLPMQAGSNPIQITTGGAATPTRVEVEFREDADLADGAPADPTQARARSQLFADWLAEQKPPASGPRAAP